MKYSFIIVNYNVADSVILAIKSILTNIKDVQYEILVVDNHSLNVDKKMLQVFCSENNISFYPQNENLGFGQACNFASKFAKGEFLCFFNPDALIIKNITTEIARIFDSDQKIAIVGTKIENNNKMIDYSSGYLPNLFFEFLNIFLLGRMTEAMVTSFRNKYNKFMPYFTGWVMGAVFFIRREIFTQLEGFDKDYFLYFEEVDLCSRVKMIGQKVLYCPKMSVSHVGSITTKKDYRFFTRQFYKSKWIFINKNTDGILVILFKMIFILEVASQFLFWLLNYPFIKNKSRGKLLGFADVYHIIFGLRR